MHVIDKNNLPILNYLKVFFRRKNTVIILAFFGMVAGVCIGMLLPRQYQSETIILVEEGKTDNPLFDKLAVSTTVEQRLETIRESMLGWNSLVTLVERLDLDKDVTNKMEFEKLIASLRKRLSIRMKAHNIIDLTYTGFDPVQTQAVVENITDIFINRNKEIQDRETTDAIAFIEEQLKVYKGKIKSAEIAKLQEQLDELLIDSTEKHPLVKELSEKIKLKKEELRRENLQYTEAETLKLESDKPIISSIKSALTKLESKAPVQDKVRPEGELYKVMLIDKLENVLARDAAVNEGIYNMLLQRLETAKITQRLQASKEGAKYTILDPPRVPLAPISPNRLLIAVSGLILGLVIGLSWVFAMEFLDKSFIDVEDAKEFLGVPLLGAISKIETEDTVKESLGRTRWIYSISFIVGMLLIAITFAWTDLLK